MVQGSFNVKGGMFVEVFKRVSSVEVAPLKDESVLFNPDTNRFCLLNGTMAFIWEKLDPGASVDEISAALAERYSGVSQAQVRDDVAQALAELVDLGLASTSNQSA
jgi:hypothetical protein